MLLFSAETSEYLHRVNDVTLLFGSLAFELLRALDVKQASLNDELLAADALIETRIIQLDN